MGTIGPTVVFRINTTWEHFFQWLKRHWQTEVLDYWADETLPRMAMEHWGLKKAMLVLVLEPNGDMGAVVNGILCAPPKEPQKVEVARQGRSLIHRYSLTGPPIQQGPPVALFHAMPLGHERLEVTVTLAGWTSVQPLIYSLLEKVAEAWPEARETILPFLWREWTDVLRRGPRWDLIDIEAIREAIGCEPFFLLAGSPFRSPAELEAAEDSARLGNSSPTEAKMAEWAQPEIEWARREITKRLEEKVQILASLCAEYSRRSWATARLFFPPRPDSGGSKKRGPTDRIRTIAKIARKWKEKHPEWGYNTVANQVAEELGDKSGKITGETIRNAYRAMRQAFPEEGWEWERADRIR